MITMKAKEFAKLIGPLYKSKVIPDVIRSIVGFHQYVPFYRKDDLEGIIHSTCYNKGWNEEFTVAIYGEVELTTQSGMKFGSCLIVPDTTPEQLAMLIERGLRMKAFL